MFVFMQARYKYVQVQLKKGARRCFFFLKKKNLYANCFAETYNSKKWIGNKDSGTKVRPGCFYDTEWE